MVADRGAPHSTPLNAAGWRGAGSAHPSSRSRPVWPEDVLGRGSLTSPRGIERAKSALRGHRRRSPRADHPREPPRQNGGPDSALAGDRRTRDRSTSDRTASTLAGIEHRPAATSDRLAARNRKTHLASPSAWRRQSADSLYQLLPHRRHINGAERDGAPPEDPLLLPRSSHRSAISPHPGGGNLLHSQRPYKRRDILTNQLPNGDIPDPPPLTALTTGRHQSRLHRRDTPSPDRPPRDRKSHPHPNVGRNSRTEASRPRHRQPPDCNTRPLGKCGYHDT